MLACGAAAPPSSPEYPSLVLPASLPASEKAPARHAPASSAAQTPPAPAAGGAAGQAAHDAPASAGGGAVPGGPQGAAPGVGGSPAGSGSASASAAGAAPAGGADAPPAAARAPLLPAAETRTSHGDLPDPQPLSQRAQWSYPITYDRGTVHVGVPELVCLPRPQATARRIGRFAFELWLGAELVDRVRFDFPLLGSEEPAPDTRRPIHDTPRFAPGAHVSIALRVPASERAARASILDRATGEVIDVTWPPRSTSGAMLARECPASPPRR